MSLEKVSPNVLALADDLQPHIDHDSAGTGQDIENSDEVFARHLPQDLTWEQLKAGQEFLNDAASAVTLAHGRVSQGKVSKDMPQTSLRVNVGHARVETTYERHRAGVAMGKEWNKYGSASTDVILAHGRRTSNYKAVQAHLAAEGANVFSN